MSGDSRPWRDDDIPDWAAPAFREVDDSLPTLLVHLVRAVAAMFSAFLVGRFVALLLGVDERAYVLQALVFAPFGAVAIFLASAVPIRKAIGTQRDAITMREERLRVESMRNLFAAELQDALEMAQDEREGLDVVGAALRTVTDLQSDVLLADSSKSHLRRAVVSGEHRGVPGCGVESPWACPAVRRGQTLVFPSSESLGACPRLRDRGKLDHACSATCVPVTVLGTPMGVIHTVGPEHEVLDEKTIEMMEGLARQAGSRIGVLRAMATSELQAATDPLTGLANRRRLQVEVTRLRESQGTYAVVLADLDHFKVLNDTYGHEVGDRALRLFAGVMRDAVRDRDLACRYGGEEFVVLLPECALHQAQAVVERMRADLIGVLANGDVPGFTASFGIADASMAENFDAVLRHADEALMRAKHSGRNRVEVAFSGV
jgi:diguanylate cyclase (GGDEF)-like protein